MQQSRAGGVARGSGDRPTRFRQPLRTIRRHFRGGRRLGIRRRLQAQLQRLKEVAANQTQQPIGQTRSVYRHAHQFHLREVQKFVSDVRHALRAHEGALLHHRSLRLRHLRQRVRHQAAPVGPQADSQAEA